MQTSLLTLFGAFTFCALFCVAILNANPTWVMFFRGIGSISLLYGMLAIWYRRGEQRAFWVGYLHGGLAYGLITLYVLGGVGDLSSWSDSQIISGEVAKFVYEWLPASSRDDQVLIQSDNIWRYGRSGRLYRTQVDDTPPNFRYLFHSAFMVFSGWVWGAVAVWLYKTRDKPLNTEVR